MNSVHDKGGGDPKIRKFSGRHMSMPPSSPPKATEIEWGGTPRDERERATGWRAIYGGGTGTLNERRAQRSGRGRRGKMTHENETTDIRERRPENREREA